jgi:predicted RNA-binding Zn ribbon-like protein
MINLSIGFIGYNGDMKERIRRGGVQTAHGFLFELTGGDISLDFVNTVDMRPTNHSRELIPSYSDLLSWGRQAGLLSRQEESLLFKRASRHPGQAEEARKFAIRLRESIPPEVLREWNLFVHQALQHQSLVPGKNGFFWQPRAEENDFRSILWPVVHSAVRLLTGDQTSRIRRCDAPNCDWLFLDTSKRGNRRWCDMTVCGNREKARRFYARKKRAE